MRILKMKHEQPLQALTYRLASTDASRMLLIWGHDHWPIPLATFANGTQVLNVDGRVIALQERTGL
jgi:hypothetical protein